MRALLLLLVAFPLGIQADVPVPLQAQNLESGIFLVATPSLRDPHFAHTVVLLIRYGPQGALGLIVNRPTPRHIKEVLPDLPRAWQGLRLFIGGPVSPGLLSFLLRTPKPLDKGLKVLDDVYFSADPDLLQRGEGLTDLRAFLGYAGWAPGQLHDEVMRGDWGMVEGNSTFIFDMPAEDIWPALIHTLKQRLAQREPMDR